MILSRRAFLIRSGWVAGGVTVLGACQLPTLPTFAEPTMEDAVTWVQLTADGTVRFYLPRTEMGQGISTGLTQVVAEELNLPLDAVECVYPTTADIAPAQMTVGSQSIENFFEPTARAAATLRELLRSAAAAQTGSAQADLSDALSGFRLPEGRLVTYLELAGTGTRIETVDPRAPLRSLRPREDRRLVGRPCEPVHVHRIVTGAEIYSRDVMLEELAFGAVARPPFLGAELEGHDRSAAEAVPGVLAVVAGPDNQVGVVAETPMAAATGIRALAARWSALDPAQLDAIQAHIDVDATELDHTPIDDGNLARAQADAVTPLTLRYRTPMTAHAAMEPRAGVARLTSEPSGALRLDVWTGSQDPWTVQGAAARAAGLNRDQVVVRNHRVGGAFGGRLLCQASVEAAWLASAVDRPVKVQWTREEEFRHNYVGPQFSHRIDAGLDADGQLIYWHHRMAASPILFPSTVIPRRLHWLADIPADPGTMRGTETPYAVAHRRIDFADVRTPMPTGAWRGLGAAPNTFAVECAMDELALAAGADPLAFRIRHSASPRLTGVMARLREKIGDRPGAGVAATAYKGVTFVAVAAEVAMVDGAIRVKRMWCVHDCGRIIAPDQVLAQIQGNLVWGISTALFEEFVLEEGIAGTDNFDTYRIARSGDVGELDIELIDSEEAPSGAGEAAFAPAAAAIANALAAVTGSRQRSLPLVPA